MRCNQFNKWGIYPNLLLPAFIVLLSACGAKQVGTMYVTPPNVALLDNTELMFTERADQRPPAWDDASSIINDMTKLRGRLEPFADNPGQNLGNLILDVRNKNANAGGGSPGTNPFKGLGGGYFHTLLRAAQGKVNQRTGEFDGNKVSKIKLSGRITDYTFERGAMGDKGKGTLVVDTYQTVMHGSQVVEVHNYVWDIRINPNGYKIQTLSRLDPEDPFPGTLVFPQEVLERIADKKYNVKLHARGNGAIRIQKVFKDGFEIRRSDHDFRPLLQADAHSCVDIFLKVPLVDPQDPNSAPDLDKIPTDYTDLIGNFEYAYCLGRCAHPAIINSR